MADNKPTNLQKSGPGLRGFRRCRERAWPHGGPCRSAGKPAAPAPTDSCRPHVSRNTVCGGSKRMRTLPFIRSAASGRSDRTSEREDFAVLISTRNPAGCKSHKTPKAGLLTRSGSAPSRPDGQWQRLQNLLRPAGQELTATGIVADSHCIPFSSRHRPARAGVSRRPLQRKDRDNIRIRKFRRRVLPHRKAC